MKLNQFLFMCLIISISYKQQIFATITEHKSEKLWSILICTLQERKPLFERIYNHLTKQINNLGLNNDIEILYFLDNREHSVGYKRNNLLQASCGKYICFADDDDMVSNDYIKLIYDALLKDPDCVSLTGEVTTNGADAKKFVHSIRYNHYFEQNNVYFRPPNHLNPIRRSIAIQFKFPEINVYEDQNWAMQIAHSGLLKKEEYISQTYYFYLYKSK